MSQLNDDVFSVIKEFLIDYDLPKLGDLQKLTKPALQGLLFHYGIIRLVYGFWKLNKFELLSLIKQQWKINNIDSVFINKYIVGFKQITKIKKGQLVHINGIAHEYLFKHNQEFLFYSEYMGKVSLTPLQLIKILKLIN